MRQKKVPASTNVLLGSGKHQWIETELWDRAALKCSSCELHILDAPMPIMHSHKGSLYMTFNLTDEQKAELKKEGYPIPQNPPVPKGAKLLRSQTSNVLNVGFKGKTREDIIAYAENAANRTCQGKNAPGGYAQWK